MRECGSAPTRGTDGTLGLRGLRSRTARDACGWPVVDEGAPTGHHTRPGAGTMGAPVIRSRPGPTTTQ